MSMHATRHRRVTLCALMLAIATPLAQAGSSFPTGEYVSGSITMRFGDDGVTRVMSGGKVVVEAAYSASDDQIRITDKSGPWACTNQGEETGVYRWKYAGGTLSLTAVEDRCKGRSHDLAQSWQRKS